VPRPDFPRSLLDFQRRFATEDACRDYLTACRWPDGFVCPRCGKSHALELPTRRLWRCLGCRRETSITAGTVLHRTRISLRHWFWASYLVTTHTPGLSALQLHRQLGLKRYETAWAMLHKLRRAMVRPARERLQGRIEVDEAYVGATEPGRPGRQLERKFLVAGAVELRQQSAHKGRWILGRIRLALVPDASSDSLCGFVQANVEPGATVLTDAWLGYAPLYRSGYDHRPTKQGSPRRAEEVLPHIHRIFGNLQTWLRGTHHGISRKHAPAYLNEFTFRFNRRRSPMAAFQTLLGLGGQTAPTTYNQLYAVELTG